MRLRHILYYGYNAFKYSTGENLLLEELLSKTADIQAAADRAAQDKALIAELVDGLTEKNEDYRYNCSKILHIIGQKQPELMYPYWDKLAALIDSPNSYHRMSAVNHLAYLVQADTEKKFDAIFDKYYSLLNDPSVIVAIYLAQASGRIALARPDLMEKITTRLLDVDKTHHLVNRRDLIKAGIIESFDRFFGKYPDKTSILLFVKKHIDSSSPKTRNLAKAFIKKWVKRKTKKNSLSHSPLAKGRG
jgi:hypothetical protein